MLVEQARGAGMHKGHAERPKGNLLPGLGLFQSQPSCPEAADIYPMATRFGHVLETGCASSPVIALDRLPPLRRSKDVFAHVPMLAEEGSWRQLGSASLGRAVSYRVLSP